MSESSSNQITGEIVIFGRKKSDKEIYLKQRYQITFSTRGGLGSIPPYTYQWFIDNTPIASGEMINYTWQNPGSFRVTLTITDNSGQKSNIIKDVVVIPKTLQANDCSLVRGFGANDSLFFASDGRKPMENISFVGMVNNSRNDIPISCYAEIEIARTYDLRGHVVIGTYETEVLEVLPGQTIAFSRLPIKPVENDGKTQAIITLLPVGQNPGGTQESLDQIAVTV